MRRRRLLFLISILLGTGILRATVPNRLVYQGRLSKSGVGVAGPHLFQAVLVSSTGATLSSQSQTLTLPASGEFTLVLDGITGVNWLTDAPKLKISVDGEALSPQEEFAASPYAYVAAKVDAAGVTTTALADGAVTDAKVAAAGLAAAKVKLSNGASLSAWEKSGTGKIDAALIIGTVTTASQHAATHRLGGNDALTGLDRSQIQGTAVVASTNAVQTIQPSANVLPLQIKGNPGGLTSLNMFEVWDNAASPALTLSVRGDGAVTALGKIGIGRLPAAPLDVQGDPMNLVLRNAGGTANQRAWTFNVAKPSGDLTLNAVNDDLATSVNAMTLGRTGTMTVSSITATNAIVGSLSVNDQFDAPALAARVTIGNSLSVPSNTFLLPFDTVDFDHGGFFSIANPERLTAPKAGVYLIEASVAYKGYRGGYRGLIIERFDGYWLANQAQDNVGAWNHQSLTAVAYLNAGAWVVLRVDQAGAINLDGTPVNPLPLITAHLGIAYIGR